MCIVWFQVELDETNAFGISPDLVFTAEEELSGDNVCFDLVPTSVEFECKYCVDIASDLVFPSKQKWFISAYLIFVIYTDICRGVSFVEFCLVLSLLE